MPFLVLSLCVSCPETGGFSGEVDLREADVREKAEQKGLQNASPYLWRPSQVRKHFSMPFGTAGRLLPYRMMRNGQNRRPANNPRHGIGKMSPKPPEDQV